MKNCLMEKRLMVFTWSMRGIVSKQQKVVLCAWYTDSVPTWPPLSRANANTTCCREPLPVSDQTMASGEKTVSQVSGRKSRPSWCWLSRMFLCFNQVARRLLKGCPCHVAFSIPEDKGVRCMA